MIAGIKISFMKEITALEAYFSNIQLPHFPIQLNSYTKITDVAKFINGHLSTLKANDTNPLFAPYLERLHELKEYCEKNAVTSFTP